MDYYIKQGFWSEEPEFARKGRRDKDRKNQLRKDMVTLLRYLEAWPFRRKTLMELFKCRKRDFLWLFKELIKFGVITPTGRGKRGAPWRLHVNRSALDRWEAKIGQPTILIAKEGDQ
jgi:hypothetical protein